MCQRDVQNQIFILKLGRINYCIQIDFFSPKIMHCEGSYLIRYTQA